MLEDMTEEKVCKFVVEVMNEDIQFLREGGGSLLDNREEILAALELLVGHWYGVQ